ncbi:hypothetical protein GALMADRAFT_128703 [Galerina marginata CBS 339.88]|uniref:Amidohydrolase-related domain-containing protein n=1 Tax=Galerina marginata (strain CBS 339.88) TaxID=685588 RepID=A0A067SNE8_GALM3|nr:hypothetical protein GALMADRAFT_128703 [Galerina marginata CBS 339.88]
MPKLYKVANLSLDHPPGPRRKPKTLQRLLGLIFCTCVLQSVYLFSHGISWPSFHSKPKIQVHRASLLTKCREIHTPAGPPPSFSTAGRVKGGSDRWVPGTPSTLLRNAKIWTGARNGTEVVYGDVLLDRGVIVAVGYIPPNLVERTKRNNGGQGVKVVDAGGKWVTPGLVDLHSHIGVSSAPNLNGASDGNSHKAPILPWLRSIDGLNTHDDAYELVVAGGVTTAQILPGSANNIGGQAFVIKLRSTEDRSVTSKVIEPPLTLTHSPNGTEYVRWRHMKHACGENPDRRYGQTRMDAQWNFRHAYDEARKIRDAQDIFCAKVEAGDWVGLVEEEKEEKFPEDLQWESLVDVLRGRVKVSIHCYEAVDLDGIVRLSNEFKFPVASFHHAGETYLVPDLLKKTWGGAPSIALFASNFRKKREAYRGSEFAPRVLAEHGIPVVMKSDHPVLNSRYLMFEAQQAHYYGLHPALALASVTSVPARAAGLGYRVGTIAEGYDADIVIWDSHPLTLGATPEQVYIDGIAQLISPHSLVKPSVFQDLPEVPNWDKEKDDTVKWEGLPPLRGSERKGRSWVKNVKTLLEFDEDGTVKAVFDSESDQMTVLIEHGKIISTSVSSNKLFQEEDEVIDLKGGSIAPGLTTYGAPIGLVEIRLEDSTNDGPVLDPLVDGDLPSLLAGKSGIIRAVDGLLFEGRNTLLAYKSGVTTAITAPSGTGFLQGISTAFSVGAPHALAKGAVVQQETALHVSLSFGLPVSVSTQVSALRTLLFGAEESSTERVGVVVDTKSAWEKVREGAIPLVVSVESSDIMATLVELKSEYQNATGKTLQLTFSGGSEAHLLAKEIAAAGVSVILTSPRPYPGTWEQRRILPGPPLSKQSSVMALLNAGVNVAIGVVDESSARNTRFEVAWAALESNGTMTRAQAISLASSNLHKALGLKSSSFSAPDLMMYSGGGILDFESKVAGVISATRGVVEVF